MTETTDLVSKRRSRRFTIKPAGLLGLSIIVLWVVVAFLAPKIAPYNIGEIADFDFFGPMSQQFWLGSDYLGRDVLSRLLIGSRFTLGISFAAVCIASGGGIILGMAAAISGGWIDTILSRFLDALNSIPNKLFALVIVAMAGSSIPVLIVMLGIIYMPGSYRFARALAVNVGAMDFITIAKLRGESLLYIIVSEILPNIIGPVLADLGLRFVFIVLVLSGLSFLGLGVQPPNADWGAMVKENIDGLAFGAPAVILPGLAIASLTIAVNLFIDNLPIKIRDRSV